MLVHVGGADVPVDVTFVEDLHHVLGLFDHERRQILHVDACVFVAQIKLGTLLVQQVNDLLVVNFEVRHANQVLLNTVALNLLEDVIEGTRHETSIDGVVGDTSDREGLACTGLTICKNGTIVTLDDVLADRIGSLCEDCLLLRAVPKEERLVFDYTCISK